MTPIGTILALVPLLLLAAPGLSPTAAALGHGVGPTVPARGAVAVAPSVPTPTAALGPLYFQNDSSIADTSTGTFCAPNSSNETICYPQSQSPTLLHLADGALGLGYSEVTTENSTTCPNASAQSISRIAFAVSSNAGVGFGAPSFVGSVGSAACPYFQEIEPSFAVSSSGEIFGAYIGADANRSQLLAGFNAVASAGGLSAPIVGYVLRPADAVLLVHSINDGTTWSSPTVVVAGSNLARPQIATEGSTVYIVYENTVNSTTTLPGQPFYPSNSQLVVSTNGGSSFGTPIVLPALSAPGAVNVREGDTTFSPSIAVGPSGEVAIAYVTNRSCQAYCQLVNPTSLAGSGIAYWGEDTVLITSTNNGSTWSPIHVVGDSFEPNTNGYGTVGGANSTFLFQWGQSTSVAWNDATGALYVAWSGAYNLSGPVWYYNYMKSAIFESTSTNAGSNWTTTRFGPPMIWSSAIGLESYYNPVVAVDDGNVYTAFSYYNNSLPCGCSSPTLSAEYSTWVVDSSDGITWGAPALAAFLPRSEGLGTASYQGYTSSIAFTASGMPIVASALAAGWLVPDGHDTVAIESNVTVSTVYSGTTGTVTFRVTGLSASVPWSVAVDGNVYNSTGGAFAVAGVPVGPPLLVVPQVAPTSIGYEEFDAVRSSAFTVYAAGATQTWNLTTWVGIDLAVEPSNVPYFALAVTGPRQAEAYTWSAQVGENASFETSVGCSFPWYFPLGANLTLGPSATGGGGYVGTYTSAEGDPVALWNGTGPGNFTGTGATARLTLDGPINETLWVYPSGPSNVSFEAPGLPSGVTFDFRFDGQNYSGRAGGAAVVVPATTGVYSVSDVTATSSGSGYEYFGAPSSGNPILVPADPVVDLSFANVEVGASPVALDLHATNLSEGDAWQVEFNGSRFGSSTPWWNTTVRPGIYPFEVFPAVSANGSVEYAPQDVGPNVSVSAGTPVVSVGFARSFRLLTIAGDGGAIASSAPGPWFGPSAQVLLTATPASGYGWNGWSGTGIGSYSGGNRSVPLTIDGPITEAASFYPLVADRFNITFYATGIPAGVEWTVFVGDVAYSGSGPNLTVPNLYSCAFSGNRGRYAVSAVEVLGDDVDAPTRFVPTGVPSTVCGGTSATVAFAAQYLITVGSTSGGTATASAGTATVTDGSAWFDANETIELSASPSPEEAFLGWSGTGSGNYTGPSNPVSVEDVGPIAETAAWVAAPTVPPRYSVQFALATPLLAGTVWSVSLNGVTYASDGSTLVASNLTPGGYTANVLPPVAPDPRVEYLPELPSLDFLVASDTQENLSYRSAFWLSVDSIGPGSISPSSEWVDNGSTVTLTALPDPGDSFAGWTGNGTGSFTGLRGAITLHPSAPLSENASFLPPTPATPALSGPVETELLAGAAAALGLLGLWVGWGLVRRRGGGRSPEPERERDARPSGDPAELSEGSSPGTELRPTDGGPSHWRSRPVDPPRALFAGCLAAVAILLLLGPFPLTAPRAAPGPSGMGPAPLGTSPNDSGASPGPAAGAALAGNVSFVPLGLPSGTAWSVTIGGRTEMGKAPGTISWDPASETDGANWTANAVAPTGYRFVDGGGMFAAGGSRGAETVRFQTEVELNLTTVPALLDPTSPPTNCSSFPEQWDGPCPLANYVIYPAPGISYWPVGSTVALNATPLTVACSTSCGTTRSANLSFLSWTGSGLGSVNTSANRTEIDLDGPVAETANFLNRGFCEEEAGPPAGVDCVPSNATLEFEETGLPSGTAWSVSTWDASGTSLAFNTTNGSTPILSDTAPTVQALTDFLVWPIPGWVPTTQPSSPVILPQTRIVEVTFRSTVVSSGPFESLVEAVGLPSGSTAWTASVAGDAFASVGPLYELSAPAGSDPIAAAPVVLNDSTEYEVSAVDVESLQGNGAWQNSTQLPDTVLVDGPVRILLQYSAAFEVYVAASVGGAVTPAGPSWVDVGTALPLNATPAAGMEFLEWTGVGTGAYSGGLASPTVIPYGAVRELATFRPAAEPSHALTVEASGLPADALLTVVYNGTGYTAAGSVTLPGVVDTAFGGPASISIGVPVLVPNASEPARFLPTSLLLAGGATVTGADGNWTVAWTGNATATVDFSEQYLIRIVGVGPGSVTPGPGPAWEAAGSTVELEASPAVGARFLGWTGMGPGSVSSSEASTGLPVSSDVEEIAQFLEIAVPVHTYTLALAAHGLPKGLNWSVSVGGTFRAGSNTTLAVSGLNGSAPVALPVIPDGIGVRYAPVGNATFSEVVDRNLTVDVGFAVEFEVWANAGVGGRASANATWAAAGSMVTIEAVATLPGYRFVNWTGSPYSGGSEVVAVTVDGPVLESALFARSAPAAPSLGPLGEAALLVAAAALPVGAAVGWLVARRSRRERWTRDEDEGSGPAA